MSEQTIVALSTPVGRSAIAVVRMSGEDSIKIAGRFFHPMPDKPNFVRVGKLQTEHFAEQAMCVYFVAPHSYTGENTVEFYCHGGISVPQAVIQACLDNGARMATNGEFSKRAFVNGKQNLTNAEGIIEMIDAETVSGVKAGVNLLNNKLGELTVKLQDKLTDMISRTEVALDYPEEDLELPTAQSLRGEIAELHGEISQLLGTVSAGRIVKYGINVAIAGRPNVGKSSLLNAFLGSDRAIVSSVEGTTRDTLNESIAYKDTKFNFVDTAGIRNARDEIEKEGIRRTNLAIADADVVLFVTDRKDDFLQCDKKIIKVYNKGDVNDYSDVSDGIVVSARTGQNVELLKQTVYDAFRMGEINNSDLILTNQRHIDCLKTASELLKNAEADAQNGTLDCVASTLHDAWQVLGEITGTQANEDIIDRIYSKFCLGK